MAWRRDPGPISAVVVTMNSVPKAERETARDSMIDPAVSRITTNLSVRFMVVWCKRLFDPHAEKEAIQWRDDRAGRDEETQLAAIADLRHSDIEPLFEIPRSLQLIDAALLADH